MKTLLNWSGAPREWFGTPTHPGNVIGHWICPQGNHSGGRRRQPRYRQRGYRLAAGQQKRRLSLFRHLVADGL
jgi:hypothetical protein